MIQPVLRAEHLLADRHQLRQQQGDQGIAKTAQPGDTRQAEACHDQQTESEQKPVKPSSALHLYLI